MEKIKLTPWNELPENMRLALVDQLLEEWPEMNEEERQHVIFHNPDSVIAAGLMPPPSKD